jgi:hypothetical protein
MTIGRYVRISLIAMCMVVATSVLSQNGSSKEEPNRGVEILALMNSPSVCLGADHLSVRLVVTNQGREPVDLDVSRLSTTGGFLALIDTTEMKFRHQTFSSSYDFIGHAPRPSITTLAPNGFFEKDIEIPIRDPFFSREGLYKLSLSSSVRLGPSAQSHDVFSSSSTIFELRACESQ